MLDRPNSLLRRWTGPLTDLVVLHPGQYGLGKVPASRPPAATRRLVCGFCATGCSLLAHVDAEGQAINLTADPRYPVNRGMACPKGWEALTPLKAPDRATQPLLRGADGVLRPVSWEVALDTLVTRFRQALETHGPDAAGYLSTGQMLVEDMAMLGIAAKFGLGITHGDGNTRQCMATAVTAYKEAFGFDAPPFTYADFEESDTLIFVGANPCIAHPILWQRVMANRRQPQIIVIDPRRTETAMAATQHLAIKPKGDLPLFYAVAHVLVREGWLDRDYLAAHTVEAEAFMRFVADYPPSAVAARVGLDVAAIEALAHRIHTGGRVSFWWTMGVNQSHEGTRTAQAMINLCLLTGNIGKPGTGPNSITGQCNAMGSRLFSNTTNLLGGHNFENPGHRAKLARVLGIEEARIPTRSSWDYARILEGAEQGVVKALWFVATNPAHSWMDLERFTRMREKLDFLVVQDMYASTETARLADLILPAAGWGEKDGTFINAERRIGVARKVAVPPGQALSDFHIFRMIAERCGLAEACDRWPTPEALFLTLTEASTGQPCDISGIRSYDQIEAAGGIQWPFPAHGADTATQRRLFADGQFFTPDGKARFRFDPPRPMPEEADAAYPLTLLTGRGTSAQWHTQTRTAKSAVLRKLYPKNPYIEIHPADAERLGLRQGQPVRVESRRGAYTAAASITPTVPEGHVFIPMHDHGINRLTVWAVDPHSRQPAYKCGAVRLVAAG